MSYQLISSFSTGEWSEWEVVRHDRHYYLLCRVRVSGSQCPQWAITKAEALAIASIADCERIARERDPIQPIAVCA